MRVIISAGGTGGHIYPALAIINTIKEKEPNSEFLYIGTHNRMEKDIVPNYNIPFKSIEIYGLSKSIKQNIKTIKCLIKSFKTCKKLISDFKPDIVIGVGGYVTVPVIISAKKLGYRTFIHEQNSLPGKSNRFLSKYADVVGVSFESSLKYFSNAFLSGNPCSEIAIKMGKADKRQLGFSINKKLILITMGSLGSKSVNSYLLDNIVQFKDKDYEVLIITGKNYYDLFKDLPNNVKALPFYEGLPSVMKICDLFISRAGASTLSEIMALEVPSILIPSPYVANNHQYLNALDLTEKKAAILLEEKDLNGDKLFTEIDNALNSKLDMKSNLRKISIKNSSSIIYDKIKQLQG